MNRQHLYEEIIGRKLNGLAAPDVAGLWPDMEAVLDKEMPQQKKKRFGGWRLNGSVLVIAGLATVCSVYGFAQRQAKTPRTKTQLQQWRLRKRQGCQKYH